MSKGPKPKPPIPCELCGGMPTGGSPRAAWYRRGLCWPCYRRQPAILAAAAAAAKGKRDQQIALGLCTECGAQPSGEGMRRCAPCYEKHYAVIARRRQRYKDAVFARYGNACACCGETEPLFLSIDHINGGGNQERKELGRDHYIALAQGPRRDDLRVLCHNCNRGRWLNGGTCPHEGRGLV